MPPRRWLPRRSKWLEHNHGRGLFLFSAGLSLFGTQLCWWLVDMKDQLESLVLQMYRSGVKYSEAVTEFQKSFILTFLNEHKFNQVRAAEALGVHRNTLRRMARALCLDLRRLRTMRRRPPLNERGAPPARKSSVA